MGLGRELVDRLSGLVLSTQTKAIEEARAAGRGEGEIRLLRERIAQLEMRANNLQYTKDAFEAEAELLHGDLAKSKARVIELEYLLAHPAAVEPPEPIATSEADHGLMALNPGPEKGRNVYYDALIEIYAVLRSSASLASKVARASVIMDTVLTPAEVTTLREIEPHRLTPARTIGATSGPEIKAILFHIEDVIRTVHTDNARDIKSIADAVENLWSSVSDAWMSRTQFMHLIALGLASKPSPSPALPSGAPREDESVLQNSPEPEWQGERTVGTTERHRELTARTIDDLFRINKIN